MYLIKVKSGYAYVERLRGEFDDIAQKARFLLDCGVPVLLERNDDGILEGRDHGNASKGEESNPGGGGSSGPNPDSPADRVQPPAQSGGTNKSDGSLGKTKG